MFCILPQFEEPYADSVLSSAVSQAFLQGD